LLPEKFHHLLCSYIPLDSTSLNLDDRTAHSCNDVGTYTNSSDHDIGDFTDADDGYCLSTSESNNAGVIYSADAVTADELLHVVSSNHLNTVRKSAQQSSYAGRITDADAHNIAANSPDADISDKSPGLHIGRVGFKAKLRVNVENLTELQLWQKGFAERSKTTMRYANVSICTGKKTLYKVNVV